jgi:Mce-associated membrane protein
MTRPRLLAAAVVLLALAVALGSVLLARGADATVAARADALEAATARVPDLLSYDRGTLERDLDRARDQTTGAFADDYRAILADVVEPTARRRGLSTEASVSAAGVVRGDRDEVVVLVFLTQTTTVKGRSSVSGSRLEVTMRRTDDSWKIAGLDPV